MDTNISLEGGARVEIKNINSVKGAYRALKFEITRQKNLRKRGVKVKQETRAFMEAQMITRRMRTKETAEDYRYIPDPDIPPLLITEDKIREINELDNSFPSLVITFGDTTASGPVEEEDEGLFGLPAPSLVAVIGMFGLVALARRRS